MDYKISNSNGNAEVQLEGKFTFADNAKFRELLKALQAEKLSTCAVELSRLEFMDSAGLCMLILLKDTSVQSNFSLTLKRPQGQVEKILRISKFEEEIPIES